METGVQLMNEENQVLQINVGKKTIDCRLHSPPGSAESKHMAFILTHGAGGDMHLPQLVTIATKMAENGFTCLRFTCKGLNIAHRIKVYRGILEYVYDKREDLGVNAAVLAGRSMGSRAATMLVNELEVGSDLSIFVKGVVCISYPLHPPKDKTNLRDGPLINMDRPCLLISGSKDMMCDRDLLYQTLSGAKVNAEPTVTIQWVEDANHSLHVKGVEEKTVLDTILGRILSFCSDMSGKGNRVTLCSGDKQLKTSKRQSASPSSKHGRAPRPKRRR